MKCLDVVKEDMQEVGEREDEVFTNHKHTQPRA